jgi:hypothetical protein
MIIPQWSHQFMLWKSFPYGQVKPPLDQDSFDPRHKVTNGFLLSP